MPVSRAVLSATTFTQIGEKRGTPEGIPLLNTSQRLLEQKLQSKFQLTHACGRPRRSVGFDVGDLTRVAAAVDASVPLVRVEAHYRVIEQVKGIHAELHFYPFGNGEVLEYRSIRKEGTRTTEAIHTNVTQATDSGIRERSRE